MDRELRALQDEVSQLSRSGTRGRRDYSARLRERIIHCASRLRREGSSVHRIARELGVPLTTLVTWTSGSSSSAPAAGFAFREVAVSDAPSPGREAIALVTPQGYRVEGLGVAEIAALLRALS